MIRRSALLLVVLVACGALLGSASDAVAAEPRLPDLRQGTPFDLSVATDGRRYHLGFGSVVFNYGDGPLRIHGSRGEGDRFMVADQLIDASDGPGLRVPAIGRMRYVDAVTHRHWHYEGFDTYSLRRPDGSVARPDQKTGFCLGDRLEAPDLGPLPGKPRFPALTGNCGYDDPGLLEVDEGISPGYGDDYGPHLEGQFVDITRLPAGRYVLVHQVNSDGALREKSLADNAASVLIDVRWRRGRPVVAQVARCPLSATCPVAPRLTRTRVLAFAQIAFRRAFDATPSGIACGVDTTGATCDGRVRGVDRNIRIAYSVARGRLYWAWFAPEAAGPGRTGRVGVKLGRPSRVPVGRPPEGGFRVRARAAYCPLIGG